MFVCVCVCMCTNLHRGNQGGENGRLLVFGGTGGASQSPDSDLFYKHGMKNYLDQGSNTKNFKVFDDLW